MHRVPAHPLRVWSACRLDRVLLGDPPSTAALPSGGLVTLVVVGVFLMIVAIIGWLGVRFSAKVGGRYVLGIYATVLIILMIMEFAAAGALVSFTGQLDAWVRRLACAFAARRPLLAFSIGCVGCSTLSPPSSRFHCSRLQRST